MVQKLNLENNVLPKNGLLNWNCYSEMKKKIKFGCFFTSKLTVKVQFVLLDELSFIDRFKKKTFDYVDSWSILLFLDPLGVKGHSIRAYLDAI